MMKTVIIFLGLFALSLGSAVPQETTSTCLVQNDIDDLLRYITQPNCNKKCRSTTYNPEAHIGNYKDAHHVHEFLHANKHDMLLQERIFSVFDYTHLKQAIALFKLFYYAKDTQTFLDTAYYARRHLNEGLFLYAFSVAVLHRPDTRLCKLTPIYEVYPYYFFDIQTMYRAQIYKQKQKKKGEGYKILEPYYERHTKDIRSEKAVPYFINDVDLNRFYYEYNLRYPFWMGLDYISTEERRGEMYYYIHQQILARYYLERISNDVGVIPMLDFTCDLESGFYSSMQYHNGLVFPVRPNKVPLKNHADYNYPFYSNYSRAYRYVNDYARRIRDVIDSGYVFTEKGEKVFIYDYKGFEILSSLIEGNPDSLHQHFYGYIQPYIRHLLGFARFPYDKNNSAPSVLEHFETSMRDPVFYQLYKLMMVYFQDYKMRLQPYTEQDLLFPGVTVDKFEIVGKLRTYFELVFTSLKYGVYYDETECPDEHFHVGVEKRRMNHEFFKYKLMVKADKAVDAIVRVYIGPKYDEQGRRMFINENRMNFFEIDTFPYNLKAGDNEIMRKSTEMHRSYERDTCAFPQRFLLPRGKIGGQVFDIYVIVNKRKVYESTAKKIYYDDTRTLGFPFDRLIDTTVFYVPNSMFQEVTIYHSMHTEEDQNKTTQ